MERRPKSLSENRGLESIGEEEEEDTIDEEDEDEEIHSFSSVGEGDCETCGREEEEVFDWYGMEICYDCIVLGEAMDRR